MTRIDLNALAELHIAARDYGDAFDETDPKKDSPRREDAHRRLCDAARAWAVADRENQAERTDRAKKIAATIGPKVEAPSATDLARIPCGTCDGYDQEGGASWHRVGCPQNPHPVPEAGGA